MRDPLVMRAAAGGAALALALTGCTGSTEEGGGSPSATTSTSRSSTSSSSSSTTSSSSSTSTTSSSPTRTVSIKGAPRGLTEVVAEKYGAESVKGTAKTGTWKGGKTAVVTAGDDVTLAVRPRGFQGWKVVGGWWPSLGAKGRADLGGTRHILLIGSDARSGQSVSGSRADALQLVGVDGSGGGGIMGLARDLWVPIPGHGHGKLNSAMVYGGPSAEVQAVSELSGVEVDGYVVTGFGGFKNIIDELGGLSFDAPKALNSHLRGGQIAEGYNHLTGTKALAWARERKSLPDGDFGRSRNQGLLLAAAAVQARLKGPEHLPEMLSVVDKNTYSDLTAEEMLLFTASFYKLSPTKVGHEVAKGDPGMQGGQSMVRLDRQSRSAFKDFEDGRLD